MDQDGLEMVYFICRAKVSVFNKITDAGLNWFLDLGAELVNLVKFIALGTADTPVQYSDTRWCEQIRKPIAKFEKASPILLSEVTFLDTEANFTIKEIGLFAGAEATLEPNTGILVARSVVSIDKTSVGSLKIKREDRIGRGN